MLIYDQICASENVAAANAASRPRQARHQRTGVRRLRRLRRKSNCVSWCSRLRPNGSASALSTSRAAGQRTSSCEGLLPVIRDGTQAEEGTALLPIIIPRRCRSQNSSHRPHLYRRLPCWRYRRGHRQAFWHGGAPRGQRRRAGHGRPGAKRAAQCSAMSVSRRALEAIHDPLRLTRRSYPRWRYRGCWHARSRGGSGSTEMIALTLLNSLPGDFYATLTSLPTERLKRAIVADAGRDKTHFINASASPRCSANRLAPTCSWSVTAYQLGAIPVSSAAIEKAGSSSTVKRSYESVAFHYRRAAADLAAT